jgi:DNA-binding NtrC family response regulator
VLIIEDECALRVPVSKMLRKQGFTVVEVGDGLAAVEVFQADPGRIDVVLLDMTLPGKSGQEVFMELKLIRPDVKVILTSAYSQGTMLPALDETDVWAFIRKPYRLNELAQLIGRACLERREFGASASGAGFSS